MENEDDEGEEDEKKSEERLRLIAILLRPSGVWLL